MPVGDYNYLIEKAGLMPEQIVERIIDKLNVQF
jgi:hypothetical protein